VNAERVKQIVQEVKSESTADEIQLRQALRWAYRQNELNTRRIKAMSTELVEAETNASVLNAAIARADAGDPSSLMEMFVNQPVDGSKQPQGVPVPACECTPPAYDERLTDAVRFLQKTFPGAPIVRVG